MKKAVVSRILLNTVIVASVVIALTSGIKITP